MIQIILSVLSAAVTIFTILCFIEIILTWFPGAKFTSFGKFISKITEPYLTFFSKKGFFRIGNLDFSPVISIGLLSLVSSILGGIQANGKIHFGGILASVIYMLWSMVSTLLTMLFLLLLIRWIVLLVKKGQTSYDSGWARIDGFLSKLSYQMASLFVKNNLTYQKALLISWITSLFILIFGRILIAYLVALCTRIPF